MHLALILAFNISKSFGAFIYYRNFLLLKLIEIHHLKKCENFEVRINSKK